MPVGQFEAGARFIPGEQVSVPVSFILYSDNTYTEIVGVLLNFLSTATDNLYRQRNTIGRK